MAATPAEIAESLTMDEIPVKLRCAACNKLANNAFRMPCCDQSICEACQSSLPQACPVCLHEPVKADDCRPNKALRTTIKVFLRKKGIEHETARKKEMVDQAAIISANSATPHVDETPDLENRVSPTQGSRELSHMPVAVDGSDLEANNETPSAEAQMDIARPSIESPSEPIQQDKGLQETDGGTNGVQEKIDQSEKIPDQQQLAQGQAQGLNQQWPLGNVIGQGLNNGGFGFDATNGFPNMGFNPTTDFSQMMQFMPSGMPNNALGGFPNMMNMPAMGMDPMAMSQAMYGGFGGQGMGMNGMNAGMGFNAGQGAFGGFNGQPGAWSAGQDKFNQNAYGGHANGMVGDYGPNAGYGGYNMPPHQGNFNQIQHHQYPNNDFQNGYNGQGFHNRGRGRGRGNQNAGRVRGGYNQVMPGNQANYEPFHHQVPSQVASSQQQPIQQSQRQAGVDGAQDSQSEDTSANNAPTDQATDEQLSKELDPGGVDEILENPTNNPPNEDVPGLPTEPVEATTETKDAVKNDSPPKQATEEKPAAIETFISSDVLDTQVSPNDITIGTPSDMMPPPSHVVPLGPAALYSGDQSQDYGSRGRGIGRGFQRGASDYRGGMRGRGSAFVPNGIATHLPTGPLTMATDAPLVAVVELKGLGVVGAPKAPKALREGLPNTSMRGGRGFSIVGRASAAAQARPNGHAKSRSPSPARSRSPSRDESRRHRTHRHRSTSSSNSSDRERRRERRRRRSHKHEDADSPNQDMKETRTGGAESESKRSSHRSHRDSDKDREVGRSSHRSHRSQRDRSRERDGAPHTRRKRSKSNGDDSRANDTTVLPNAATNRHKEINGDSTSSTHKRRDRDDEDYHRDRKRSRHDRSGLAEDKENLSQSRHGKRNELDKSSNHDAAQRSHEKPAEKSKPLSTTSETDHHNLEREARNRERLLKEFQRREAMEGKGPVGKKKDSQVSSRGSGVGRRVSYKYEDEESNEARANRVENEREAGRWE